MLFGTTSLQFASQVERIDEPELALEELHRVARFAKLNLFGCWQVPIKARSGDHSRYPVRIHSSVPPELMEEYWQLYRERGRSFLADLAWRNHGAFTMTEALRLVKPSEPERWIVRLVQKHGMRDLFLVPNGSWMVVYWSPKVLRLEAAGRAALQFAAGALAARLARLAGYKGLGLDPGLSGRQRAALRLVAQGYSPREVAAQMGVGQRTAKEHLDRARQKLGAKNLPHAVAEAFRRFMVIGFVVTAAAAGIFEIFDICCWDAIVRVWT